MYNFNDTDRYDTTKYSNDFKADKLSSLKRSIKFKVALVIFISLVAMLAVLNWIPSGKKYRLSRQGNKPVQVGVQIEEYPEYIPTIVDNAGLIKSSKLQKTLDEYFDLTGVCVEFNTLYDEDWQDQYSTLAEYNKYVYDKEVRFDNSFVLMFSVSKADLELVEKGELKRPHYVWSSYYSDVAEMIIFDAACAKEFGDIFTGDIKDKGMDPEDAAVDAFEFAIKDAQARFATQEKDMRTSLIIKIVCFVIIIAAALVIIVLMLKKYYADKKTATEETAPDPYACKLDQ